LGTVAHLFLAKQSRQPMREVDSVIAQVDRGLEGCRHARAGSKRQVLLAENETLDSFGLHPGEIRENISTKGLSINNLPTGQRLVIGEAVLEVTGPCEPCSRMDEIRMGLQQELTGQRGTLCRVVEGGRIQSGDTIQLARANQAPPTIGGTI
jgi:MOSC domain-containing protein YiiM